MRTLFPATVAAILLSALITAPALALDEYRVTGVAANDSLNMREDVGGAEAVSETRITGKIPSDGTGVLASGVTVKLGASLWREVQYGGVTGWVNGRFLERVGRRFGDILPEDMDCAGTEPFWSLEIRGGQAVYEHETAITYSVASRTSPANRNTVLWAITLVRQGQRAERIAVVREAACDDGMSANEFPYSALIFGTEPAIYKFGPFMGCCSMPR